MTVRQNAGVHRQLVGRALGEQDWETRDAAARTARLREALARDESPPDTLEARAKRALWVFEAIEYCRHRYGAAAVGSYVVSMARDVDDILSVLLLARWAGFAGSGSVWRTKRRLFSGTRSESASAPGVT